MVAPDSTLDARLAVSAHPPPTCANCGSDQFETRADGGSYCRSCGTRRPSGRDSSEADLGVIAGGSDLGTRHQHNEDGYALAVTGPVYAGAVCDGVSSSSRPDMAAHAAAEAAIRALLRELSTPGGAAAPGAQQALAATASGISAARTAAVAAAGDVAPAPSPLASPPGTTLVSAVVTPDAVTVGWIGDSRAYWVGADGSAQRLTVDDTLAGQLAAAGVEITEDAPNAGVLLQWLGADAAEPQPHIVGFQPTGPGQVVVCSDGLHRYAPEAENMAETVRRAGGATPIETVRALIAFALDNGGADNVTVIILPYPPR